MGRHQLLYVLESQNNFNSFVEKKSLNIFSTRAFHQNQVYFNCQINWLPIIGRKQCLLPKIHAWPPDFFIFIIDYLVNKNTSIDHFSSSKHVTIIKQEKWNTQKCFNIEQTTWLTHALSPEEKQEHSFSALRRDWKELWHKWSLPSLRSTASKILWINILILAHLLQVR